MNTAERAQYDADWAARRSTFIIRASLMFNVPCTEVTQSQLNAAVKQTENDTMPANLPKGSK